MVERKYYKIVSDGTSEGTKLLDPEGNIVPYVQEITWSIKNGELALATITMPVEMEVHVENVTIINTMTIESTEFDNIKFPKDAESNLESDLKIIREKINEHNNGLHIVKDEDAV